LCIKLLYCKHREKINKNCVDIMLRPGGVVVIY